MNAQKCLQGLYRKGYLALSFKSNSRAYTVLKKDQCYKLFKLPKDLVQCQNSFHPSPLIRRCSQATATQEPVVYTGVFPHDPIIFEDVAFDEPVPHDVLVEKLRSCKSFAEQMETLTTTLALSPEDVQRRMDFVKKIEKLFQPFFKDFKIQIFGSTANSFGFKGCDIDLTFETSNTCKISNVLEPPDVPELCEVLSGKVSPEELSQLPPKELLLFVHNVLLEYYKETSTPPIFINAFVPLVRFNHDKYKLKCDLTYKNRVAYANTKLLYLFANLDKRVSPLLMALRYWAKHSELIGKGLLFNTYTITLLIIHFFQTRNPPILPSAEYLISLTKSLENEDMMDKSFLEIKDKIPPSKNTQTLEELFKDFFFFYLYFDFTRVICPMIGASVPRDDFFADEKNSKFRMNTICVQDPMCLSHNVAELVDFKVCKKFFHKLITVCRIFQDNLVFPTTGPWGLVAILDKSEGFGNRLPKVIHFSLPLLTKSLDGKSIPEKARAQVTAEAIESILKNILLFQCSPIDSSQIEDLLDLQDQLYLKQKQMLESENPADVHFKKYLRKLKKSADASHSVSMLEQFRKLNSEYDLVYSSECKVLKNTWLGRDLAVVAPPLGSSVLDKERLISVATFEQNKKNMTEKMKTVTFLFESYTSRKDSGCLHVHFRSRQTTPFNPILGIFLKQYLPNLMQSVTSEL